MNNIVYIVLVLVLVGFGVSLYFLLSLKKRLDAPQESESMRLMAEWMKQMRDDTASSRQAMDQNISETNKQINERLDRAAQVIGDLKQKMGAVDQIGPDIRRLAETLASPKLRGNFGEELLEGMLMQVLPRESFQIQYRFKNGETVDAIVKIGQYLLPIDSKFSMENFRLLNAAETEESQKAMFSAFRRDVKKRIEEIHKKYILPAEGTFDFALMYVPSEGVYHELLADAELTEFSRSKRVISVGPNSLFAYLQNIVVSLRGQEVNKMAGELLSMIQGIKQDSDKFGRHLEVLENHIKNAGNTMGTAKKEYDKLSSSIHSAAKLELGETEKVEKLLE